MHVAKEWVSRRAFNWDDATDRPGGDRKSLSQNSYNDFSVSDAEELGGHFGGGHVVKDAAALANLLDFGRVRLRLVRLGVYRRGLVEQPGRLQRRQPVIQSALSSGLPSLTRRVSLARREVH
jgi:hypothetical protein